ncbi:hypothetical protein RvY_10046 [Ramazzottius varieornatus]|uniref:UBP-type domain-containing protein n=1 Tax=Ramazzottius varieornatus TaxID=947166 RepID=A0A1D1VDK7_RAMVA|nr:hypothetical protein RvY_10046 [Ramazzottius varieornatus]
MSSMEPGPSTGDHPLPVVAQAPFYAVHPRTDCPHVESNVAPLPEAGLDASAPCSTCQDPTENWVCLKCFRVFCSRYINGDMAQHMGETGHKVALSFADMSVWCDGCDSYISHEVVRPAKRAAYRSKFGEDFPENSEDAENSAAR